MPPLDPSDGRMGRFAEGAKIFHLPLRKLPHVKVESKLETAGVLYFFWNSAIMIGAWKYATLHTAMLGKKICLKQ